MRAFPRHRAASAAVEFGLLGGCAIGLILETLQVGLYGYQATALDRATYQAARMIKLGNAQNQRLTAASFRAGLCSLLPSGMTCDRVITNVTSVAQGVYPDGFYTMVQSNQAGTVQPPMDNARTTYCPGGPSSFVYVQTYYAMPAFSTAWRLVGSTPWQGSAVHFIAAQGVVKNEPYTAAGSGC